MITFPGPASALVTLPIAADGEAVARILKLERSVRDALPELRETIPAFNRLLVEGRPEAWDPVEMEARLSHLAAACLEGPAELPRTRTVSLPVCYDPALAPDLDDVSGRTGVPATHVARLHSERTYTVLASGFAPGFAYLGDLAARLSVPRRSAPRDRVEAGAVGIADRRTGVYPAAGPGGWRLIGRVPSGLFADANERIARFEPGGRVRFEPIGLRDFEAESG